MSIQSKIEIFLEKLLLIQFFPLLNRDGQEAAAPATYWHDPENEDGYRNSSTFLAIINNEKTLNSKYIDKIKKLNKFVLVKYADDTSIVPNESTHFGYVKNKKIIKLQEMDIYKQDRLGLRALEERGGLIFLESPGMHLQLFKPWFGENVLKYFQDIIVD